jgi:polysaccharide biosynthesis transport protein
MNTNEFSVSFEQALAALRRRAQWILLCFIVVTGAAFGYSELQTKKYTATASLIFSNTDLAEAVAGLSPVSPSNSPQSVQDTNVALVQIGDIAARTAAQLGHGLTTQKVKSTLGIAAQGDTSVVSVSATSPSPQFAAQIANTYSTIFVAEQEGVDHQYYVSALSTVERQLAGLSQSERLGAQGLALQNRAQSLATLAELPSGTVRVAANAVIPTAPSSPKIARNTLLGALLGLLLGLGVALLIERLDQRIRDPKDLEAIYGLPLLGVVPASKAFSLSSGRVGGTQKPLPFRESEAFHFIRAHLRYLEVDRNLRTLLVASADVGAGKTTVAKNLSIATAQMGSRVLLLEADLRRPTLAQQFGLDAGPGLTDVLIDGCSLSSAIQLIDMDAHSGTASRGRPLEVLVAGATRPPNPGELLESPAMEEVLAQSMLDYDQIIIDTSPLTAVSDTFPLLRKVDGVIIVGRVGRARRDVAQRLRQTLAGGGGPLLGVIANAFNARGNAPYGRGYDYAAADAAARDAPMGALAADGRRQLSRRVGQALGRDGSEGDHVGGRLHAEKEGIASAPIDLVNGFAPAGTVVHGGLELQRVLAHWAEVSNQPTVGDVRTFGASPVITVKIGADEFVLNRDTKRAAIEAFLAAAAEAHGADNLRWHVTANRKGGTINRVTYRPDDRPTPGWYAYVSEPASEPRELG